MLSPFPNVRVLSSPDTPDNLQEVSQIQVHSVSFLLVSLSDEDDLYEM